MGGGHLKEWKKLNQIKKKKKGKDGRKSCESYTAKVTLAAH